MIDVDITIGDVVDDRYEVFQHEKGGMGEVFFCFDNEDDRKVVSIKTFMGTWNQQARNQFLSEIDASLRVPKAGNNYYLGINRVFLFHKKPFIEMDYCPGGSLAQKLATQHMSISEFVVMAIEIAIGMMTLHEEYGVLHRDLKPANILFDESNKVKIADLGIAKAMGSLNSVAKTGAVNSSLYGSNTQVGTFIGTLYYASPEQLIDSSKVTVTTDIWSYGVILFETLTGVHPFLRKGEDATRRAILFADVPWHLLSKFDENIVNIIRGCLNVDSGNRFQSFRNILIAFDKVVRFQSTPVEGAMDSRIYLDDGQIEHFWLKLWPDRTDEALTIFNTGIINRYKEARGYFDVGMNQRALDTIKKATGDVGDKNSMIWRYLNNSLSNEVGFEGDDVRKYLIPNRQVIENMFDLQLRAYLNLVEEGNETVEDEYFDFLIAIYEEVELPDTIISCAQGCIKCGDYEQAIHVLKRILDDREKTARYWGTYVNALYFSGEIEEIARLWGDVINDSIGKSDNWNDLWTCAHICSFMRFVDGCLYYYGKMHNLEPNDQSVAYNYAIALINSGDRERAKAILDELKVMNKQSNYVNHLEKILNVT